MKKLIALCLLVFSFSLQARVSPHLFKLDFKDEKLEYFGVSDYDAFTIELGGDRPFKSYEMEKVFKKICLYLRKNRESHFTDIEIQMFDGSFWSAEFSNQDCSPHFIRFD